MNPGADAGHQIMVSIGCLRCNDDTPGDIDAFKEVTAMLYRHTQPGLWIVALCLVAIAFDIAIIWQTGQWVPAAAALVVLIAVAILFSSLTVEVSDKELSWRFGPGFWTYRLPLGDIEKVAVVRNHWWNGFGIRMASGFRLYNVSGLDAVELHLKSHDIRRIGTDDPQGLANALQSLPRNK
jgi:hypothetical protein